MQIKNITNFIFHIKPVVFDVLGNTVDPFNSLFRVHIRNIWNLPGPPAFWGRHTGFENAHNNRQNAVVYFVIRL